jgi:hypothetical protein
LFVLRSISSTPIAQSPRLPVDPERLSKSSCVAGGFKSSLVPEIRGIFSGVDKGLLGIILKQRGNTYEIAKPLG